MRAGCAQILRVSQSLSYCHSADTQEERRGTAFVLKATAYPYDWVWIQFVIKEEKKKNDS